MHPDLIDRLRDDLTAARFTTDTVADLLGDMASAARERGNLLPARRRLATRERSALSTLVRVFLLGEPMKAAHVAEAFPALGLAGAATLKLVERETTGTVRAALALNPVRVVDSLHPEGREWWIISDLDDHVRRGPARPDHVMGVGGATRSLIAMLPPRKVDVTLDLGTGCGIVALHLATRGMAVATDLSARALTFARANARLNQVDGIDFREGDLYTPVQGERFDLIATNPPFVISPTTGEHRYTYREAGLPGDELAVRVVTASSRYLRPGGELVTLANWEYPWGEDGLDRARGWVEAAGASVAEEIDGWILERDSLDPAQYAELWARDAGLRPGEDASDEAIGAALADFAARRVVRIGLGSIRIRRREHASSSGGFAVRAERATGPQHYESLGRALDTAFTFGATAARMSDAEILLTRWRRHRELREIREHRPGEEAPHAIVFHSRVGIERRIVADTLLSAAVGACDGELTLGQIADALATLLEVDEGPTREALAREARELAWLGVLQPEAD